MKQHTQYNVGIYCRLSRDDDNYSESESITNQKRMLAKYVEEKGWSIYNYYIDDGISGTTFNRPGFLSMISDINDKKINLVITKDLSRLGRDYIMAGHYIEVFFPEKNVRYIAVNDGIDTQGKDNDIAPFKNVLNEMYAKDISKKVRAAFKTKAENGEFIGAFAPYGYKKHPDNKNKLIIDEYAADIVRRIFRMATDGLGLNKIARILNDEGICNPTVYKKAGGSTYNNNLKLDKTTYWTNSTIRKILNNQVYIGTLAQGKQRTKSFKCKKKVSCSENDWIVIEDSHEPVIDIDTWSAAQKSLTIRKREMSNGESHIFSGIIKCLDCGRFMALGRKSNGYRYFVCSSYKAYGPNYCSRHGIGYDYFYSVVLNDIKYHAELAKYDENELIKKLTLSSRSNQDNLSIELHNELSKVEARIKEIDVVIKKLYEDKVKGNLSEKRFNKFCLQYDDEQERLSQRSKELNTQLVEFERTEKDINYWLSIIKEYTDITELDKLIITELIDSILIGERKAEGDQFQQEIKILYKFSNKAG